ncbi:hypothetical protein AB0O91_32755 [Kitasatospora sp. NPDC089797]
MTTDTSAADHFRHSLRLLLDEDITGWIPLAALRDASADLVRSAR